MPMTGHRYLQDMPPNYAMSGLLSFSPSLCHVRPCFLFSPSSLLLGCSMLSECVRLIGWDAVSASLWSCLFLVCGLVSQFASHRLGCCVRLPGLVCLLSPVLFCSLSPIWSGMLRPALWSCLSLVCSFLVSQLISQLVWDAVSVSGLVFLLSPSLSPIWSGPSLSSIWSEMLCPPPSACLCLLSGLVSQLVIVSHLVWAVLSLVCLQSRLGCCVRFLGLAFFLSVALSPSVSRVSHLVWDAVFAFLGLSFSPGSLLLGSPCFLDVLALPGMLCPPSLSPAFSSALSSWMRFPIRKFCFYPASPSIRFVSRAQFGVHIRPKVLIATTHHKSIDTAQGTAELTRTIPPTAQRMEAYHAICKVDSVDYTVNEPGPDELPLYCIVVKIARSSKGLMWSLRFP